MSKEEFMHKDALLACWQAAINAVNGRSSVTLALSQYLSHHEGSFDYLIAIGKAASHMTLGAYDVLLSFSKALVVTKHGHVDIMLKDISDLEVLEAGHPIPDQKSLLAGSRLISFISELPLDGSVLMLISGGASSLVEVLPPVISLGELQQLNEQLIATGLPIEQINAVRKSLSKIKGGKLARYLSGRETLVLMISDVPDNRMDIIGSGPVTPDCHSTFTALPAGFEYLKPYVERGPGSHNKVFNSIESAIIANNAMACEAAVGCAKQLGFNVVYDRHLFNSDIASIANQVTTQLLSAEKGIYIWGGESTVILPEKPGKGGRNQALAMLLAQQIKGTGNLTILVAGTDGNDGPTDAAGAWVNGQTILSGNALGLDANIFYQKADVYTYFNQIGNLFKTGPTGTNVMDLVIAMVD